MFLDCPTEVLYKIFPENDVVQCCKRCYNFLEEKYKTLNKRENYLIWDESKVQRDFSERMIYFSNQIFREMLGRQRNLRCGAKDEKASRICKLVIYDSYFLKMNHIFKICANFVYSQIEPLKEIPEVSNQQYSILNNFFSELSEKITPRNLDESDEKINRPFLKLLKNNKEIMQLRNTTLATESQLERILELDEYATRQDVLRFFDSTRSVDKMLKFSHPQFDKIAILKLAAYSLEQRNFLLEAFDLRLNLYVISGNNEDKKNMLNKFDKFSRDLIYERRDSNYQQLYTFCVRCFDLGIIEPMKQCFSVFSEKGAFKEAVDCKERLIKQGESLDYGDLALDYIELGMLEEAVNCYDKCTVFRYGAIDAFEPLGKFQELLQYFSRTTPQYRCDKGIIKELKLMEDFCQRNGFNKEREEFRERREKITIDMSNWGLPPDLIESHSYGGSYS